MASTISKSSHKQLYYLNLWIQRLNHGVEEGRMLVNLLDYIREQIRERTHKN
ncbi:hypothetical protein [Acaryochloris marina]|uniref:Uncharacterized protein n=1 Tax=Acaryochloris marina (strain MBIC 11017) TaxID=329726 RepID=B0CCY3_ACAM1|nr:hypothetical protein [Acaryochloris marina]ABW30425.1 hypothetical protein AM1_5470 [Acaryochloris marina MBIC11017]